MKAGLLKHTDAIKFILAGNSTFTFLNTKTGNRFTYSVKKHKENAIFFVKVLTGPENYTFIGTVRDNKYKHSIKSAISPNAQSVDVFQYILNKLVQGNLSEFIEIWHEGKCGKCGRQLTVPSSIESGIGPECSKMLAKASNKASARDKKIDEILA